MKKGNMYLRKLARVGKVYPKTINPTSKVESKLQNKSGLNINSQPNSLNK